MHPETLRGASVFQNLLLNATLPPDRPLKCLPVTGEKGIVAGLDQSFSIRSSWLEGMFSIKYNPGTCGWLENVNHCGVKERYSITEKYLHTLLKTNLAH